MLLGFWDNILIAFTVVRPSWDTLHFVLGSFWQPKLFILIRRETFIIKIPSLTLSIKNVTLSYADKAITSCVAPNGYWWAKFPSRHEIVGFLPQVGGAIYYYR